MGRRIEKKCSLKVSEWVHNRLLEDKKRLGFESIDDVIRWLYKEYIRLKNESMLLQRKILELKQNAKACGEELKEIISILKKWGLSSLRE